MRNQVSLVFLLVSVLSLTGVVFFSNLQQVRSANLTNVSITLSNSRPSFRGALAAGNTAGASSAIINTTAGAWPSTSTAQLVQGDVLLIGEAASLGTYTVTDLVSASTANITPVLATGDIEENDDVIATSSATLTVRFTTANAINDGSFRILLPAVTDDAEAANGIPDGGAFDFGTSAPTVTCPTDLTGYDFSAGTATASYVTIAGVDYHAYVCAYTGAGAIGTVFDGVTNDAITIDSVINPAPKKATHTAGYADTYRPIVQHLDSGGIVADSTTVSIGVVEAVRVTAEVAPQITFRILGLPDSTTACGEATTVATTATSVPFGPLSIDSFTYAAQGLSVSTNAANGYVVTAVANDQLGRNGGVCTADPVDGVACIQDARGDGDAMTHTTYTEWSSTAKKGFGYSLDNINSSDTLPAFSYDGHDGACDGSGTCYKQFADAEDSQAPQTVMSYTSVADNHNLYVCYKAIISATQAAGNYENYITYTATATF